MASIPAPTDQVGTKLLFENDSVRVWDLRLEPGEAIPLHRHDCDYVYVVIGDGRLQTEFADGSHDPPRTMRDGEVRYRSSSGEVIHGARNVGEGPWRNIVVELKRSGAGRSGS